MDEISTSLQQLGLHLPLSVLPTSCFPLGSWGRGLKITRPRGQGTQACKNVYTYTPPHTPRNSSSIPDSRESKPDLVEQGEGVFTQGVGVSADVAWHFITVVIRNLCLSPRVSAEGTLFLLETLLSEEGWLVEQMELLSVV